jgi:TetR/AcrR family transcriptional regulator, tetracycline repressor protein
VTVVDRTPLNRDRIASAALDLIDAEGMPGLSMRKLGAQLGVEAMSLYHYVRNKDDLLDAVLDRLYAEIDLPSAESGDWEATIRAGLRSFRAVLLRHPAAIELFATRPARSPQSFSVLFWAYGRFRSYGLDLADANAALHFAVSFVMGHVWNEHGTLASLQAADLDGDVAFEPSEEEALFLVHCRDVSADSLFEIGLDTVVAGLRDRFRLP